jgi:hypothetical protein
VYLRLSGHLFGTSFTLGAFLILGWGVSFLLDFLNSIYPFPVATHNLLRQLELFFIGVDSVVCVVVLSAASYRFIRKELGGQNE